MHAVSCSVVAKDELDNLLAHHQLGKRVPLLFLANKMDLPTALVPVELAQVWHQQQQQLWSLSVVQ
jgi:signal recognition particle receptor subunit beta